MNKENEEEMLSFDGDIYFERMFSPICFSCSIIILGRDDAMPSQNVILYLLKFGLENGLT